MNMKWSLDRARSTVELAQATATRNIIGRVAPVVASVLALTLSGCGAPEAPDIRSEMSSAVSKLGGIKPVYPLTETLRLGTVLLVDASVARPFSGLAADQETSFRITSDLEPVFEKARRRLFSTQADGRFSQSPSTLGTALRPATTGSAFYRQTSSKPEDGKVPPDALTLAAMPGYTLASVDELKFGAFLPDIIASFFASIGLRRTSYLRMEAEGIEVAELPLADVLSTLVEACATPAVRARRDVYARAVALGYDLFDAQRRRRTSAGEQTPAVIPRLMLLRKVYYLRGVRFVLDDSRAAAVFAEAAIKNPLPQGATTVPLPNVTINAQPPAAGTPPPAGTPAAAPAANTAAIAALQQQIEQLRTALASGNNTQLAGSIARATATGVELVQLFDRPLAFGYQPLQVPANITAGTDTIATASNGWSPLCELAGAAP